ncbi:MAG: hypothetical protein ACI9SP_003633 [Arenicella sp.]|jgi:hypothetical protein
MKAFKRTLYYVKTISILLISLNSQNLRAENLMGLINVYDIKNTEPLVQMTKPCNPNADAVHSVPHDGAWHPVFKHQITDIKPGDILRIRSQVQMTMSRGKINNICREFAGRAMLRTTVDGARKGNIARQRNYNEGIHHMPLHSDTLYISDTDSPIEIKAEYRIDTLSQASRIDAKQSQLVIEHYRSFPDIETAKNENAFVLIHNEFSKTLQVSPPNFDNNEVFAYESSPTSLSARDNNKSDIVLTMGQTTSSRSVDDNNCAVSPRNKENAVLQINKVVELGEEVGESISENVICESAVKSQWTNGVFVPNADSTHSFGTRVKGLSSGTRPEVNLLGVTSPFGHFILQKFSPLSEVEGEQVWVLDPDFHHSIGSSISNVLSNNEWSVVRSKTKTLNQGSTLRITGMTQFLLNEENEDGHCDVRLFVTAPSGSVSKSAFSRKSISFHDSSFNINSWPHRYPDIPLRNEMTYNVNAGDGEYLIEERARCAGFSSNDISVDVLATGSGLMVEEFKLLN